MKFTYDEIGFILHCLEVAQRDFREQKENSRISESETSFYQIFLKQEEKTRFLIEKIRNSEI